MMTGEEELENIMDEQTGSLTTTIGSTKYYQVKERTPIVTHCPMCSGDGIDSRTKGIDDSQLCPFCAGSGHIVTWPTWKLIYTATTTGEPAT